MISMLVGSHALIDPSQREYLNSSRDYAIVFSGLTLTERERKMRSMPLGDHSRSCRSFERRAIIAR